MIFNSSSFGVFELLLILRVLYSFEILLDNHVLNTYEHRFGMLMVELFTQQAPYSDPEMPAQPPCAQQPPQRPPPWQASPPSVLRRPAGQQAQ